MRSRLVLSVSILFLVLSCRKDEEPVFPLGSKYAFEAIEFGDLKGYIKGRELTKDEIARFISSDPYLPLDPYNYRTPDSIYFLTDKVVNYKEPYDRFNWFYTQNRNRIQLSTDTLLSTGSCRGSHSCIIMEDLVQWKTDSIGFYNHSSYTFRKILHRKEYSLQGNNLIVPLMVFRYVYSETPSTIGYRASVCRDNKFDKEVLNKFILGDTLAIRECKLIFRRIE